MNGQLFNASQLKIKRANKHILNLNTILRHYLRNQTFTIYPETDPKTGGSNIKIELPHEPLPEQVPLILGDAVHNIRAALDILICEMVTFLGGSPTRWTLLPFRDTRKELKDALNGGIKKTCPLVSDFILDGIKPYRGGNDPLFGLHDLDLIDKHKLLIPIVAYVGVRGMGATTTSGDVFENLSFFITQRSRQFDSTIINAISNVDKPHITNYGKPAYDIRFDKGQPFEGESVIPTLKYLLAVVRGIIKAAKIVVRK